MSSPVQTEALIVRATYFPADETSAAAPKLADVAAALSQLSALLDGAWALQEDDWRMDTLPTMPESQVSILSIEMRSPLVVVLAITTPIAIGSKYGRSLVMLAERISTAPARVSRQRQKDLFDAETYELARRELKAGRADGLALELLRRGPAEPLGPQLRQIEIYGEDDSSDLDTVDVPNDPSYD